MAGNNQYPLNKGNSESKREQLSERQYNELRQKELQIKDILETILGLTDEDIYKTISNRYKGINNFVKAFKDGLFNIYKQFGVEGTDITGILYQLIENITIRFYVGEGKTDEREKYKQNASTVDPNQSYTDGPGPKMHEGEIVDEKKKSRDAFSTRANEVALKTKFGKTLLDMDKRLSNENIKNQIYRDIKKVMPFTNVFSDNLITSSLNEGMRELMGSVNSYISENFRDETDPKLMIFLKFKIRSIKMLLYILRFFGVFFGIIYGVLKFLDRYRLFFIGIFAIILLIMAGQTSFYSYKDAGSIFSLILPYSYFYPRIVYGLVKSLGSIILLYYLYFIFFDQMLDMASAVDEENKNKLKYLAFHSVILIIFQAFM